MGLRSGLSQRKDLTLSREICESLLEGWRSTNRQETKVPGFGDDSFGGQEIMTVY